MLGESDARQLEFAISQQRAIVTHNRDDFLDLHSRYVEENKEHYGIIIARSRAPQVLVASLSNVLNEFMADEMMMRILFI
jgi:hypothetical protein